MKNKIQRLLIKSKKRKALESLNSKAFFTLRGLDLNQRPSGYEPDELPNCSTPRQYKTGWGRIRTFEASQQIYSLPPLATREPIHIRISR